MSIVVIFRLIIFTLSKLVSLLLLFLHILGLFGVRLECTEWLNYLLANDPNGNKGHDEPHRWWQVITQNRFWRKWQCLLGQETVIVPNKNHCFPEDEGLDRHPHNRRDCLLFVARTLAQENDNNSKKGLDNVEPGLNDDKGVLIHVIESVEGVVVLVGPEKPKEWSTLQTVWSAQHEEGIKAADNCTQQEPELDWFGDER